MTAELVQFAIESAITVVVVFVALQAARYTAGKSSNWEWPCALSMIREEIMHMLTAKRLNITRGLRQVLWEQ